VTHPDASSTIFQGTEHTEVHLNVAVIPISTAYPVFAAEFSSSSSSKQSSVSSAGSNHYGCKSAWKDMHGPSAQKLVKYTDITSKATAHLNPSSSILFLLSFFSRFALPWAMSMKHLGFLFSTHHNCEAIEVLQEEYTISNLRRAPHTDIERHFFVSQYSHGMLSRNRLLSPSR
jgi:hypothetical protein